MFANTPERQRPTIRWLLTCGWLLLIFSLFYDRISPWLTDPNNTLSSLRIDPEVCVKVQEFAWNKYPMLWEHDYSGQQSFPPPFLFF